MMEEKLRLLYGKYIITNTWEEYKSFVDQLISMDVEVAEGAMDGYDDEDEWVEWSILGSADLLDGYKVDAWLTIFERHADPKDFITMEEFLYELVRMEPYKELNKKVTL